MIRNLMDRRFPQYVAIYLGVAWGIVQFITFLEERYGLSPHWTNFALLTFALLLPAVALFIYNHGMPGKDAWTRSEKVFIPLNLAIAGVVLYAVFGAKDLGAVTTLVTTRDETGKTIEREVAKGSYRQRVGIFNFDAPAGDTALAWVRYGLPNAVASDLSQNMFVDVRMSAYFREKLRQLGFKEEVNVPVSLKRRIATEQHLPYFVDGKLSRAGEQIVLDLGVYDANTGNVVERKTVQGADVLALADEVTKAITDILDIPDAKNEDQPASELLTASPEAFRNYAEGMIALQVRDAWQEGAARLEKAVQIDPTFAYAWMSLHNLYLLSNQAQKSMPPLQKAMDNIYRLPERLQYDVKAEHYVMKQDWEKAYAVAKMKTDLYPDDIPGYVLLATFERVRDNKDGIIAAYKKILEIDPSQHERLRELGEAYRNKGDFDNALSTFNQYAERFPQNKEVFVSLGDLQFLRGKHDLARQQFDKALLIDPADISAMLRLADLERDLGNFDASLKHSQAAVEAARTSDAKAQALNGLASHYYARGQFTEGLKYSEQSLGEQAKAQPPFVIALGRLRLVPHYIRAGQQQRAQQTMTTVNQQLQGPLGALNSLGQTFMALELRDVSAAEAGVATMEQSINTLGFKFLAPEVAFAKGEILYLKGQCEQALPLFERRKALTPTDVSIHVNMARCYRALKQPQKAVAEVQKTLAVSPFSPRANYEMALALIDAGDRAKALEHLRRATQVWEEADLSYKLAQEAKAKLKEIGG